MAREDGYRRYFEAAAVLGQITRARAEELVRELMSSRDVGRAQAQEWVDELMDRSRKAAQDLLDLVRTEVTNQLQTLGLDPDDLARQAADILRRSAKAGRQAVTDVAKGGDRKKASAKKASAKKAATKKSPAKKSGGEKASAKKAAKKAPAKKAPAKKSTAKKSPAKKSTAPAKKSAATKSAPTRAR